MNNDHFKNLARLLDLEADAEQQQMAERIAAGGKSAGEMTLTGLVVREEAPGPGGTMILTLGKRNTSAPLPPHRLQPGAPVLLTQEGASSPESYRGVVADRFEFIIRVAISDDETDLPEDEFWRVDLSSDEVSRNRQKAALETAAKAWTGRLAEMKDILLENREPSFSAEAPFTVLNGGLNESQIEAVKFALRTKYVSLIHGPPGTGKTTTVAELIRQILRTGEKVLACAPSNTAVDNLMEKLVEAGESPVRIGHPLRIAEELRNRSLDVLAEEHPDTRQARKMARDAHALFRKASKWTRAKPEPGERQALKAEGRALLRDARQLEDQAFDRILDSATVVCSTLTGVNENLLGKRKFGWLIIDEACQSPEPACWIPLNRVDRVVLAGDPFQLPPTIVSPEAARQGLAISLMERMLAKWPDGSRRLQIQYRMNQIIAGFSSREFYENDLMADAGVAGRLLCDLPGVEFLPLTNEPLEWIDTAGAGFDEVLENEGASRFNPQEADLTVKLVGQLQKAGVSLDKFAIITPYNAQVRCLKEKFGREAPEIDSVDGFQGREKEVVLISLVRSNPEGEIGFLSDIRRMNVAMTRAKRKLIIIGDSATVGGSAFFTRLLEYVEAKGHYRSVWEMMD